MRRNSWFALTRNSAEDGTIDIFDEIGFWGVTAKDFVTQLRAMTGLKTITLNINSPGGDCEDGLTIFDAIVACNATVTANVIGTAASMASVIMLAAQKIRIAENGRIMIHRVTGAGGGNPDDLDAVARIARQFEDRIIKLYTARTKADETKVRDWMKASLGTWFFGQEAVDAGFADEVITGTKARLMNARWAPMFTLLPRNLFDITALTEPAAQSNNESAAMKMTDAQKSRMKELLRKDGTGTAGKRSDAENTELQELQALATKEGYDAAAEIGAEDAAKNKGGSGSPARILTPEAFQKAITDGVTAATKPLEDRLKKMEDLRINGVPLSSWTGKPAQGAQGGGEGGDSKTLTHPEWQKLGARARADFFRNGGKLID